MAMIRMIRICVCETVRSLMSSVVRFALFPVLLGRLSPDGGRAVRDASVHGHVTRSHYVTWRMQVRPQDHQAHRYHHRPPDAARKSRRASFRSLGKVDFFLDRFRNEKHVFSTRSIPSLLVSPFS